MADEAAPLGPESIRAAFIIEVMQAKRLLDYTVERGMVATDGRGVSDAIIQQIKEAEDLAAKNGTPTAEERTRFEKAYRDLAAFAAPVTIKTLIATADRGDPEWSERRWLGGNTAIRWSRILWLITICFMVVAVFGETVEQTFGRAAPPIDDAESWSWWFYFSHSLLETLVPFTYGGLGACAYMLRSAHVFIHQRCFDPKRIPEYNNRILLGVVGGGAIVFLIAQVPDDSGTLVQLSAKALGFIAGYNSDFLFNTIERIVQALLPKVSDQTVRRAEPRERPVSEQQALIETLLDRLRLSKDEEEKKLIRSLIERFGTK